MPWFEGEFLGERVAALQCCCRKPGGLGGSLRTRQEPALGIFGVYTFIWVRLPPPLHNK